MLKRQNVAKRLSSDSGLSLLEIMLAIAIVLVSISALTAIATTATRNVSDSRGHTIADQHARATLAQLRSLRDNQGWAAFIAPSLSQNGRYDYFTLNSSGQLVAKLGSSSANLDCNHSTVKSLSGLNIDSNNKQIIRTELNSSQSEMRIKAMVCCDLTNDRWSQVTIDSVLTNWR